MAGHACVAGVGVKHHDVKHVTNTSVCCMVAFIIASHPPTHPPLLGAGLAHDTPALAAQPSHGIPAARAPRGRPQRGLPGGAAAFRGGVVWAANSQGAGLGPTLPLLTAWLIADQLAQLLSHL